MHIKLLANFAFSVAWKTPSVISRFAESKIGSLFFALKVFGMKVFSIHNITRYYFVQYIVVSFVRMNGNTYHSLIRVAHLSIPDLCGESLPGGFYLVLLNLCSHKSCFIRSPLWYRVFISLAGLWGGDAVVVRIAKQDLFACPLYPATCTPVLGIYLWYCDV